MQGKLIFSYKALHGFEVGYTGDAHCEATQNSKLARQNIGAVKLYIERELAAGRISGPHETLPFPKYHVSPLSVREKSMPGVFRIIHDLSYPYDKKSSVNDRIPSDQATVQYATLQQAIEIIVRLGRGCYLAKSDIKSAFRLIPLHPSQYHLFCFKVAGT